MRATRWGLGLSVDHYAQRLQSFPLITNNSIVFYVNVGTIEQATSAHVERLTLLGAPLFQVADRWAFLSPPGGELKLTVRFRWGLSSELGISSRDEHVRSRGYQFPRDIERVITSQTQPAGRPLCIWWLIRG